jgi:hypothetical protein
MGHDLAAQGVRSTQALGAGDELICDRGNLGIGNAKPDDASV